jgi:hypothetical protein
MSRIEWITLAVFAVAAVVAIALLQPHWLFLAYTGLIRTDVPNIIQVSSGIAAIYAIRKFNCTKKGCLRLGIHKVEGTTYRTCRHHLTRDIHRELRTQHAERHPEAHKTING